MPISTTQLIELAASLSNSYNNEIEHRTSSNRAYYSIYHMARLIIKTSAPAKTYSHHQWFIDQLKSLQSNNLKITSIAKQISIIMEECRNIRRRADYAIEGRFSEMDAIQALKCAKKVERLYMHIS